MKIKDMSIRVKITMVSLISLTILAIVISIVAVIKVENALVNENYIKLISSNESKKENIKNFFKKSKADINVLAVSETIHNFYLDLEDINKKLDIKNKSSYPIMNEEIKKLTKSYDNYFNTFVKEYDYYDVFLIDLNTGQVVYTQAKESDYGTNLNTGKYKDSGLAEVYNKVKNTVKVSYSDTKRYEASNNEPNIFIGTAVKIGNKFKAILVLQISQNKINKIMNFRKGYGSSQEDYLVGNDNLMRSDSYLDPKNHSVKASFENPSLGTVSNNSVKNALNNKTGIHIIKDYNNNFVLSSYSTIELTKDIKWAIISEIDEAEVMLVPNQLRNNIIIVSLLMLFLIGIILFYYVNTIIIKPIVLFQDGLLAFFRYLNKEDTSVNKLLILSNDEIGKMSQLVNENIYKTQNMIKEDEKLIENVTSIVNDVKNGFLTSRVSQNTNNNNLETLKKQINNMLDNLESNIGKD
ncbi:MAG: cache domain-containing protein, partial [Campylobacteraceae bacterium]|nr:cache domain-containing protein [Campylobacteraceae bacterium]